MTIMNRTTKLRLRRIFRRRKKVALQAADQAEEQLDRLFFRRLARLGNVRRFVVGWISLLVLLVVSVGLQSRSLGAYYQSIAPIDGGTLREGVVGSFTNANPLYAVSTVDSSISRLIFSGLFMHDANDQLLPDLAEKIEPDDKGQVYKVSIRKNISWHDGHPLTAEDVVFTYQTIQKPDAKSPLLTSWQGVAVRQVDDYTVEFSLPSPLASFPYSLTNGIVPAHILKDVPAGQLRSVGFNTQNPVGTGPFTWQTVEVAGLERDTRTEQIALRRYMQYHLGAPKIEQYVLKTFRQDDDLIRAYQNKELTAMVGLDRVPVELEDDTTTIAYNIPMDGNVMLFLNNSSELLQDAKVRQALAYATQQDDLVKQVGYPAIKTNGPLLRNQSGYDASIVQRQFNLEQASKLFDEAGWRRDEGGLRKKADKTMSLRFVSQNVAEYASIAQELQKQWRSVGVEIDVKLRPEEDMQVDVLSRHNYDVLLYGITTGTDPDVFAFWHSSQADVRSATRLNLSEYKSKVADKSLEAGRTRLDPLLRSVKYKPFLTSWRDDVPAIALYQPRFLYITRSEVVGFKAYRISSSVDRLNSIHQWTVVQDKVLKQ